MAEIIQSIVGFELGPLVPPSGVTYGYLAAPNGYVAADITTGSKRSGTYGYNSKALVNTDALFASILLTTTNTALPSNEWEMRARYFFRIATLPSANNLMISFTGTGVGSFVVRMQMDTTGQLRVVPAFVGGTTTAYQGTLALNTWYQFRLRVFGFGVGGVAGGGKNSTYQLDIYNEDTSVLVATFGETVPDGNNMPSVWPAVFNLGQITSGGAVCTREIHYDDFWCHLATGPTDTGLMTWPRGTNVEVYAPTANGDASDFSRVGVDTGANWSQVSDIPRLTGGSATGVNSSTASARDLYQHAALLDPDDVVYLVQNVCWILDTTTPQQLLIGSDTHNVVANDSSLARYALAWTFYTNDAPLESDDFDVLQFGVKKLTAGGTTLTSEQQFLEVLTGPPILIEADLPDPGIGHESDFAAAPAFTFEADAVIIIYETDVPLDAFTAGPLTFSLGNQGTEINVPVTWQLNRIDVGYREEEKS